MDDCAKKITNAILLIALQFSFLGANLFAQQTQFPYQAIVVSSEARVFSGPGKMHYATEVLKPGDLVQVYRHDLGNWCSIRPPQGSFSLVPEASVKIVAEDSGEIVEANTQAWVGTAMGAVEKPLWQVKLKIGEPVKILGEVSWPDADGNETVWYQISPPNGEFRWIHLDDIQIPKTELPGEFEQHESSSPMQISGEFESYEERNDGWRPAKLPFDQQNEIRLASSQQVEDSSSQQIMQASPVGVFKDEPNENGFVTPTPRPQRFANANLDQSNGTAPLDLATRPVVSNQRPERFASRDSEFGAIPPAQALTPIAPLGNLLLTDRLRQLDLRLSNEVTKPSMMNWSLSEIAIDTQSVINNAVNNSEVVAGQRLLEKINNFRRIQDNARTVEGSKRSLDGLPFTLEQNAGSESQGTIYDAQGWLNELVQQRGAINSTYVLEDDQGRITHHVQAAPGLNLHRYLRSKIGIIGQRGYNQQLDLNHILVERLIVLEKPKR
ncbi:hypothetical protein OAG68_00255 [bacterium]|nr:hypothetical protein [bacterium]